MLKGRISLKTSKICAVIAVIGTIAFLTCQQTTGPMWLAVSSLVITTVGAIIVVVDGVYGLIKGNENKTKR